MARAAIGKWVRIAVLVAGLFLVPVEGNADAGTRNGSGALCRSRTIPSPDRRFVVREAGRWRGDDGCRYRLTVWDRKTGRHLFLYAHERSVRVIWSPDSRRLILNDYVGSNVASCWIVRVPAVSFSSPDQHFFRLIRLQEVSDGDPYHNYSECQAWTSARTVMGHVWGDGPRGFWDARIAWSLASGRMRLQSLTLKPRDR